MNRQCLWIIVLLAVWLLTVASCGKKEASEPKPAKSEISKSKQTTSAAQEVNSLVGAPLKNLGDSRKSIQGKLGPWLSLETEKYPNRHVDGQIDNIYTITYDGLILSVYDAVATQREMLFVVKMTKNHEPILPKLIGLNKVALEAQYGPPYQIVGDVWEYTEYDELGQNVVQVRIQDDIVSSVEWHYYLD